MRKGATHYWDLCPKTIYFDILIINKRVLFHENKCENNMTLCKVHEMH